MKTEWVIEKDDRTGKSTPRKVGLQPVMRDGIEYEFDVCGDIDLGERRVCRFTIDGTGRMGGRIGWRIWNRFARGATRSSIA